MQLKKRKLVKWLKPGPSVGFSYFPGNKCKMDPDKAKGLEKSGHVTILEEKELKKDPIKKPVSSKSSSYKKKPSTRKK